MMKKLVLTMAVLVASASVANAAQYLQASSSVDSVPRHGTNAGRNGYHRRGGGRHARQHTRFTVGEAGPYLIVAAPQVGREGGGPYGCFDLWLRINGADVANSQRPALPG